MNQCLIFILIFILLITNSYSDESPENKENSSSSDDIPKTVCNLYNECKDCYFCGDIENEDYSACTYENLFCKNDEKYYHYNSSLGVKYSNYFRNQNEINSFCGQTTFILNSVRDSFIIFDKKLNTQSSPLSHSYHCNFGIINKYYYNHERDKATLKIEIKELNQDNINNNKMIKFNMFMIYVNGEYIKFSNLTDNSIRGKGLSKVLDSISELELLIDFTNENPIITEESLVISIETKNPSKKERIIFIIIFVVCGFLILVIIALILIYIYIRRKLNNYYIENRQNEENARIQKEEKIKKNKELIKQLFENILTPKIFSKDIILNNCENCSICLDAFECDKSSVCITPCNHIFHYDCLKKWVDDNVLTPKCPNCNNNLINNLMITSQINVDRKSNGNNSNSAAININENRNGVSLSQNNQIRENENIEQINNAANSRDNLAINNHNIG